jgi:hypothetical protein
MTEHEASRTLVKSPPELWAECSDASSLARHLGQFGEIKITRLEPESAVAWEGTLASGTVRLEPSGWGTRVILTARRAEELAAEPVAAPIEEPVVEQSAAPIEVAAVEEPGATVEPEASEPAPRLACSPSGLADRPPQSHPADVVAPKMPAQIPALPAPLPTRTVRKGGLLGRLFGFLKAPEPAPPPATPAPVAPPPKPVAVEPEPEPEPEPVAIEPEPKPVAIEAEPVAVEPEPMAAVPVAVKPEPVIVGADSEVDHAAVLTAALDSLGQAHHRPFSR